MGRRIPTVRWRGFLQRTLQIPSRFQSQTPQRGTPLFTQNAIAVTPDASTLLAAGEDQRIRVFNLNNTNSPPLVYEHSIHGHQIKAADQNQGGLFLSVDNHLIVVCNPHKKQIVRTLHQDQFRPEKTFFRSA